MHALPVKCLNWQYKGVITCWMKWINTGFQWSKTNSGLSSCCTHRPGLRVVPAVGRRWSELLSFDSARRGKLLLVHGDVELRAHLCCRVAPWMLPRSWRRHGQPSPAWSPAGSSPYYTWLYPLIASPINLLIYLCMISLQITNIWNKIFLSIKFDHRLCRFPVYLYSCVHPCKMPPALSSACSTHKTLIAISFCIIVCSCDDRTAMNALRDTLSWTRTILLLLPENVDTNPAEPPAETHIPGVSVHDLLASPGPFWTNNQRWSQIQNKGSICLVPTHSQKN